MQKCFYGDSKSLRVLSEGALLTWSHQDLWMTLCAVIDKVLVLLLVNVAPQWLHRHYQKYINIMTYCCPVLKL